MKKVSVISFSAAVIVMVAVMAPFSMILAQEYTSPIRAQDIQGVLASLIDFANAIVRPLAVIAILWAAFLYVSAGGNEEKVSQAHRAITYGIIGLFVVLSASFLKDALVGVAGKAAGKTFAAFVNEVGLLFGYFIMAASVIAILYSAFLFLTSGSDPGKVTTARQALLYAAVGVAVAVVAFAIPGLIDQLVPK